MNDRLTRKRDEIANVGILLFEFTDNGGLIPEDAMTVNIACIMTY
jgi:hypothetical protein